MVCKGGGLLEYKHTHPSKTPKSCRTRLSFFGGGTASNLGAEEFFSGIQHRVKVFFAYVCTLKMRRISG